MTRSTRVRRTDGVPPITIVGRIRTGAVVLVLAAAPLAAQAPVDTPDTTVTAADTAAPVAARTIPRGVELVAGDVAAGPHAAGRLGWITRRVVRAGERLTEPTVVPPPVIRSGEVVQYIVRAGGIQLAMTGTALAAASLGETVPVRLDARRRVEAIVDGPGRVVALEPRRRPSP